GGKETGADGQDAAVSRRAGYADVRPARAHSDHGMIRQTCGAHAWDGAELPPKFLIEADNLGVVVSSLPGVQLERQQVLPVESELNGREIRKRPHEQSGGDQDEERERDLRDHENAAQAQGAKRLPARLPDSRVLERRHNVCPRRLERWSKPE